MNSGPHDPRDIPILTDAIDDGDEASHEDAVADARSANLRALQSAIVAETLQLADSLLHQAAKDIEATLFENVYDRLRAELPELVNRILHDQMPPIDASPTADD